MICGNKSDTIRILANAPVVPADSLDVPRKYQSKCRSLLQTARLQSGARFSLSSALKCELFHSTLLQGCMMNTPDFIELFPEHYSHQAPSGSTVVGWCSTQICPRINLNQEQPFHTSNTLQPPEKMLHKAVAFNEDFCSHLHPFSSFFIHVLYWCLLISFGGRGWTQIVSTHTGCL